MADLLKIRQEILDRIPDDATADNVWSFLGWDSDASKHYQIARQHGVDLRPILAPIFAQLVDLPLPLYDILHNLDPVFHGSTVKDRLLTGIDSLIVTPYTN
jgi:hypothetical protein